MHCLIKFILPLLQPLLLQLYRPSRLSSVSDQIVDLEGKMRRVWLVLFVYSVCLVFLVVFQSCS